MALWKKKDPVIIDGVECWRCSGCGDAKPSGSFQKQRDAINGLKSCCRSCRNARSAARRKGPEVRRGRAAYNVARMKIPEVKRRAMEYHSAWCAANREQLNENQKARRAAHPERSKARKTMRRAVKSGAIIRPDNCEVCGADRRTEGHHDSYDRDRWLTVTWMCKSCHQWTHARRNEQAQGIWT